MQPKFNAPNNGYDAELVCPNCKSNYLSHNVVEIFDRGEDEPKGLHVTVKKGSLNVDQDISKNPSARRHGLNLWFICEECSEKSQLSIYQHKGCTYMKFTVANET